MDDNPYKSPLAYGRLRRFAKRLDQPVFMAVMTLFFFYKSISLSNAVWEKWDSPWTLKNWEHAFCAPQCVAFTVLGVYLLVRHFRQ